MKDTTTAALHTIDLCQQILTRYLVPHGMTMEQCIGQLLNVLDGPEAVEITRPLREPDSHQSLQREDYQRRLAKRREIAAMLSGPPVNSASGPVMPDTAPEQTVSDLKAQLLDRTAEAAVLAERASRLQVELDRVRAHETHLIQQRDRLIHQDLAALHKEVSQLQSQLKDSQEAVGRFAERNAKAEAALIASQDRERRISERLASIASLTSDF